MFFNPILSSSSCLISPLAILCWDCNVTWRHITTRSLLKKPCMQYGGREISDTREDNFCFSWLLPNLICRSPCWWGWISIHWRVPAVRNGWWMWKGSGGWWMPHFLIWPTCPPSYSPFQILFFAKSSLINTLNHFTLTNIHYFFGIILPPTLDSPLVQFHHFWGAPGNQNSGEPKNLGAPGKPKNLGST